MPAPPARSARSRFRRRHVEVERTSGRRRGHDASAASCSSCVSVGACTDTDASIRAATSRQPAGGFRPSCRREAGQSRTVLTVSVQRAGIEGITMEKKPNKRAVMEEPPAKSDAPAAARTRATGFARTIRESRSHRKPDAALRVQVVNWSGPASGTHSGKPWHRRACQRAAADPSQSRRPL